MIINNNFPSVIRVNKAKNFNIPQTNDFNQHTSSESNNIPSNFPLKINDKIYYNSRNNEFSTLSNDNYNKKQLNHYQSEDSLNDQLNLIKFKMSCDLIGQKINQLKTFVDCMKLNDENKKFKKITKKTEPNTLDRNNNNINNSIIDSNRNNITNYSNNVIKSLPNYSTSRIINNSARMNLTFGNKSLNHISSNKNNNNRNYFVNSYQQKNNIGKYSSI